MHGSSAGCSGSFSAFLLVLLVANAMAAAPASAFHDGGTATCEVCHVMHGEQDGPVMLDGGDPMLTAGTATDVCLACHGGQHGVFGHNPLAPPRERGAGNFVFLLEDNLNDAPDGFSRPIAGEAAGHSVVSVEMGTAADSRWTTAPGGDFPSAALGCTSCHDPHGNGNFRMLHGEGEVQGGLFEFLYPAPDASGVDCCSVGASESRLNHSAYRGGMSMWCANCHGMYHDEDDTAFEHPVDENLDDDIARTYRRYNGSSDPFGGDEAMAYLTAVPFESPTSTVDRTDGPDASDEIMCLSCHRAHASSAPASGRWDFNVGLLQLDGMVSGSWRLPNPYRDRDQGPLCQKCHGLSIGDHDDMHGD